MKAKIDLEKFVRSLMERYYEKIHIDPTTTKCWLDSVLEDQGLEYKDGEIVEIEKEQPYNKPLFFEKDKWYTCIAKVDGFKVGHTYQSKIDGTVSNDSGAMYMYHNDINLIFRPATEEEIPKEQEEREDLRKRYERIGKSDWFKKNHEDMSITIHDDLKGTDPDGGVVGEKGEEGEPETFEEKVEHWQRLRDIAMEKIKGTFKEEDSLETKAIKEQIESLKKRIEDNQLGYIVQRLDKIIELLSWKPSPSIAPYPYTQPITYDTNKIYCGTASTEGGEE